MSKTLKHEIFLGRNIKVFGTDNIGTASPFFTISGGAGSDERECLTVGWYSQEHYESVQAREVPDVPHMDPPAIVPPSDNLGASSSSYQPPAFQGTSLKFT